MTFNHSQLASELGISLRTLDNHKKTLQDRYGIELTVKQGRSSIYLDSFLSLVQASVRGDQLPDSLESWSYPEFQPSTMTSAEIPTMTVNSEVVTDDLNDSPSGSLVTYQYQEPVKLAIRDSQPIDLSFMVKRSDLSGLQESRQNSLDTLAAIDSIRLEVVKQMAEKEGDELAEMYTATVASKLAKAKAQTIKDALGNG